MYSRGFMREHIELFSSYYPSPLPFEETVKAYARTGLASSDVESLIAVLRTGGTLPTKVAELASR